MTIMFSGLGDYEAPPARIYRDGSLVRPIRPTTLRGVLYRVRVPGGSTNEGNRYSTLPLGVGASLRVRGYVGRSRGESTYSVTVLTSRGGELATGYVLARDVAGVGHARGWSGLGLLETTESKVAAFAVAGAVAFGLWYAFGRKKPRRSRRRNDGEVNCQRSAAEGLMAMAMGRTGRTQNRRRSR